jgi:hypothetical protein
MAKPNPLNGYRLVNGNAGHTSLDRPAAGQAPKNTARNDGLAVPPAASVAVRCDRYLAQRVARISGVFFGLAASLAAQPSAWAQPLGSTTSQDGKVRVEILSLKRTEGDTATLRLQIVNDGNENYSLTLVNMRLIDIPGRRFYSPGLASNNCSAAAGEHVTCYAVFGAPPAAAKAMTVQFYEKLDLISGVPIGE